MNHTRYFFGLSSILLLAWTLSAIGQDTGEERRLFKEAHKLSKAGKYDDAVATMKKVVKLAPRNDRYLAALSEFEFRAGKYADGMEHALQAIRLNNKVGIYHALVAINAARNQDLDRAREYAALVLKHGPKEFGAEACRMAREVQQMLLPRTYTLHWKLDPKKGRRVRGTYAVALPRGKLPYQSVTFEIDGVRAKRLVKGTVNDVLYITPGGWTPFPLTTTVTVRAYSFKKELDKAASQTTAKTLPAEARASLGSIYTINVRSPALVKVATGLKGGNSVATVRNILAWMKKNVEYKLKPSPISELDFKTVDDILARGHAECRGYALLFTALCRAAGVPARPIWGLIRIPRGLDKRVGDIASHNWAECYIAGCGWVPVDPQRPETFGFMPTNILRFFMDAKKGRRSPETLPILNLVFMNGDRVQFDEKP